MDNLSIDTIRKYLQELEQKGYTDLVIARKLSSIVEFINWAYHNDLLKYSQFQQIKDEIANYEAKYDLNHHSKAQNKDIAPHVPEDAAKVSLLQKLRNKVPFLRQNSDKPVATTLTTRLSPQYYLGMAFVVLITGILGAGIYERFLTSTDKIFAYPPSPSAASRILSFQGRLTDSLGNPITASTNMRFRLYTASSGGTTLYDTGTCSITPDQDGVHNVLIGSDCGSEIASSVFTENTQVWLGVLVGSDAEMTPRQRIANVPYAINAETLQGLPVGTEVSTIPYINAGGDLLMAAASPQIGSTYTNQDFLLSSARAITVQSAGTGDVTLTATESGTIKFATGGTQHGLITNTGLFGIGTTGPDAKLDVLYTGGEQLRLTYTDGSNYTAFTTDSGGDVTIDPSGDDVTLGGDLILADTFTVQVGGKTATAYNAFANSGDAPEEAAIAADNDVYIGGDLEVDGTIYGTITASALPWSGLTAPTTDLTVAMAAYNTTFTWDPGANTTETAFTLNFDGEDSAADEDQVLMALNQTSNGTDVTEAADALLTFTNSDANDPVENAIRFDAGAAGTDFTYGINFDAASIGTAEFVLQNGETISNTVDGTIALGGNTDISGTLLAGTADAFQVDASGNVTAVGGTLSGDLAVNGGDITSTATTFNFDIGNTGTLQFRDGSNTLVAIKDQGAYPFLNLAGKTDTGDPASCAEGDIYYNDTDDTIKVCHESNTWEALDGGVVATSWTDSGTTVYLTDTTDEVVIGGSTPLSSAKVSIDGDADQIQLIVQGNATQTSNLATFEQSDGTDVFSVTNAGNLTAAGDLAVNGDDITADGALTINSASYTRVGDTASPGSANGDDDLFIEGDLEVDGVLYTDGGIDTTFTAGSIVFAGTSGVLAQDNTNFFWDDTNNKLGLGDTTPDAKFELSGAATGKALTILNETGDQDIIAASASGTTRFRVSNDGTVYGGYFADISNTAYGIDPAGTSNFGGYSLKVTGGALLGYDSGSVGIGDQTPDAKLNILATTEQLRLDYDDSNYTSFTVSSGGDLTVAPTGSDFNVTGNGDFSGGLNVASSNHFNIDSSGNIGIGTTAASGYGSRMVKSISAESINGYYTDHQAVTYSGTLTGSRNEYGRMTAITNSVDLNGQSLNYYLNQAYFTNSHTSFSGSALGYWAYMTNTVAANNAAMTGFRSDVVNSSTATGQTLTGYTTTTSNGGGTIANSYGYYSNLNNSSSGTISNAYRFYAASPSNASGTITTTYGAYIADQSVGTNTTAYGLYIANQSGGSGDNVGLYIADADDYSIQLASTDGNAASGITFGTDTNLYRSAANTLHTDDNLDIDGNITADGDLAINGDDITADGALTINSASYTRVGDTASPGSANGDDDLFIEGDLEIDGVMYLDGTLDTTFTAGSIVFAGTSGVLAQDNTNFFWDDSSNELGIGDTTPDAFLDITGTTEQLRLSYETGDTNYTSFTTSSGGDLTIAPSGSDTNITGNLAVTGNTGLGNASTDVVTVTGNQVINFDTASSNQNGLYINSSQNTATAGTLRGLNLEANFWATSGTQTGVNGLDFTVKSTGNGGTVTTMKGISAWGVVNTGSTVTTFKLVDAANPTNSGTVTSLSGFSVDNLTSGSNNTLILAGTSSIPSGNWGVYNTSSYTNYFAGTTGIGTTGPDAKLDVLSTTEQLRLTYADASAYSSFTVSSGGDLTIAPNGGDTSITGTLTTTSTITGSDFICTDCLDFAEFEDTLDLDASLTLNQGTSTWTQNFTGDTTTGLTYNANSITTGTAIAINSTATSFSSGTLLSLDWSPGSLNTNADDLFKINTTNNGSMSGYYINLLKNSSSVFNIDQSGNVITTGDIAVNGDDITSDGTLTIDAATDINLDADGADIVFKDGGTTVATFTNSSTDLTIVPAGGDVFITGNMSPTTDDTYDLGSDTNRWRDLYLGPDTLHIGTSTSDEGTISYTTSTNVMNIGGTGDLAVNMSGDDVTINDRVTIGSATAGVSKLTVTGAETGKALAIFNETGNQNVIVASVSGSMVFGITNQGDITHGSSHGIIAAPTIGGLVPNGSYEVDSNSIGLPDAWYIKTGSATTTSTTNHGDVALLLESDEDISFSSCIPIAPSQSGSARTYTMSGWFRTDALALAGTVRGGLYTYTSRANCIADSGGTQLQIITSSTLNNVYAFRSGTGNASTTERWARVYIKNDDSDNDDVYADGIFLTQSNATSGLDIAETYPADVQDNIQIGEIVAFGNGGIQNEADVHNVKRSQGAYDKNSFGVVATQPGLVLDDDGTYNKIKVALKGRVPVLVSSENGPINVGDPITASSKPGVGMKATKSGRIIGYAMTEWTSTDPNEIDQVTVFINPETYVDLSILTSLQESVAQLPKITTSALTRADDIVINAADAVLLKTESLVTQSITAVNATIDTLLVDRIVGREIVAENITSDTIETQNIQAKDATISGKLVAQEIDADNIRELRDRLERLASDNETSPKIDSSQLQAEVESIQKYLEDLPDQNASQNLPMGEITNNTGIDPGTTTSMTGDQVGMMNVEKLMVTGESAMTTLVVADSFTAGNIFVKDNSILSLSSELKLSALEQISLMDGAVIIAKNGTITAKGEIIAEKGIRTNTIKPLDTNSNIGVQLSQNKVEVLNNNAIVAAIDNNGSAKFRDVSVDTYTDATNSAAIIAANDNYEENGIFSPGIQTNAAAAGNGILPATHDSVVIFNDKIGPHTLVYVTATSKTFNQNLYVAEKKVCSELEKIEENCKPYFAVHIDGAVKDPISFNWWTVN